MGSDIARRPSMRLSPAALKIDLIDFDRRLGIFAPFRARDHSAGCRSTLSFPDVMDLSAERGIAV
jgi:hypothetical protein